MGIGERIFKLLIGIGIIVLAWNIFPESRTYIVIFGAIIAMALLIGLPIYIVEKIANKRRQEEEKEALRRKQEEFVKEIARHQAELERKKEEEAKIRNEELQKKQEEMAKIRRELALKREKEEEEVRRQKQEEAAKWLEAEAQRRQMIEARQRELQEETRRRNEEEFRRQQAEKARLEEEAKRREEERRRREEELRQAQEEEERRWSERLDRLSSNTLEMSPKGFFNLKERAEEFTGVYILHNESKDMYYIGQSVRVLSRVSQHFTGHGNGDVYADFKYGDTFTIRCLSLANSGYGSLDALEKDFIKRYNAHVTGYNKTQGNL